MLTEPSARALLGVYTAKDERRDEGDTASPRSKTKVSGIKPVSITTKKNHTPTGGWRCLIEDAALITLSITLHW